MVYKGKNIPQLINNWLLDRIVPEQIAMTCEDIETLESALEMGAGIGPVPSRYVCSSDKVVPCFELPPETINTGWLLAGPSAYRRAEVKAFVKFFAPRYSALFREE